MKQLNLIISIAAVLYASNVLADNACKQGEKRFELNAPCMPDRLVDYLYCLQKSGGGKVAFKSRAASDKSDSFEITFGEKPSGVIVQGYVSGASRSLEAANVTRDLEEKLRPDITASCKAISSEIKGCEPEQTSDWERTDWNETLNPSLNFMLNGRGRIVGAKVQVRGSGVIATSTVTVTDGGRAAHAQCAAQNDANSRGECRIVATVKCAD